jgi:hypothetical protein
MGKYHCTIDLLFDWFGLVCFANKNKNCQFSYSSFQTIQTGGQLYSDASPFSIATWSNALAYYKNALLTLICLIRQPKVISSYSVEIQHYIFQI